uniref:GCFC domain-containing protein n=1 Tax=Strongyloides venezuelensis TaxID=75913 RepID=A0A0K0F577_STRVS
MFRKPKNKRNIRQKEENADGDEEEVNIQLSNLVTSRRPVSSFNNAPKNDDDTNKVSELLRRTVVAYNDNEDDEVDEFKIKKKNPKKRYEKYKESLNNYNNKQDEKSENISNDISTYIKKSDDVVIINESTDTDVIFLGEEMNVSDSEDIINKEEILKLKELREKKRKDLRNGYIPLDEGEIITINSDDDSDIDNGEANNEKDNEDESNEGSTTDSSIDFEAEQMSKVIKKKQIVEAKFKDKRNKIVMGGRFDSNEMFDAQNPDDDDYENRTYIDINFELDNEPQRDIKTIIEDLTGKCRILQDKYDELIKVQEHIKRDEENCRERVDFLESNKEFNISKCVKYKDLKIYIDTLLECINTKIDLIKNLEKKFIQILKERNSKVINLRKEMLKAEVNFHTVQLKNNHLNEIDRANLLLCRNFEGANGIGLNQFELDTLDNNTRMALENEIRSADVKLEECFNDTQPIYYDIKTIIIKILEWIEIDEKGFNECNAYQHIWKFVAPYVRKEIIKWNPLFDELNFKYNKFEWYEKLLRVGIDERLIIDKNHEYIVNLIPSIMANVVLPKLIEIIKDVWDPYSGGQCQRLANVLFNILNETPTLNSSTEVLNNLFQVIKDKFEECIDESLIDVEFTGTDYLITSNRCQPLIDKNHNVANNLVNNILNFKLLLSNSVINSLINDKIAKKYRISSLEKYLL